MAKGYGAFEFRVFLSEGFKVHGDTEWRADFILAPVAPANCSGFVIEDVHEASQFLLNFPADFHLILILFQKGKNSCLDGSDSRIKAHDGAGLGFPLGVNNVLFVKGLAEQSKDRAVTSGRRLYYMGNELFLGGFVEIFNRFSLF